MTEFKKPVLLDGAMGTYLEAEYNISLPNAEEANLVHPGVVRSIHEKYIGAGAHALVTNTYAANTVLQERSFPHIEKLIDAGCTLAKEAAAGRDICVFGCIGPIPGDEPAFDEYHAIADRFLLNGITHIMLQTFPDPGYFAPIAQYIKQKCPEAFVACSGTVGSDGYSHSGVAAQRFLDEATAVPEIDMVGFNCSCGPAHMLHIFERLSLPQGKAVSAMPNAGFPQLEAGRTVYSSSPEYFAKLLVAIAQLGVQYIGGCCGTTPAHIRAVNEALRGFHASGSGAEPAQPRPAAAVPEEALPPRFRIAVELDPPADTKTADRFFERARQIRKAGADVITIADCPVGRARGDSALLAAMLRQKCGIVPMPHMTCRDRNINASKALLLGMYMSDVHRVLVVTGDPVPAQEREGIKTVFQFSSVRFIEYIQSLNQEVFADAPFRIGGALNVNAVSFRSELDHAKKKVEAGATVFLTQPVMDTAARENYLYAKEELGVPILAGIMPIVSYRNACFVNNEMGGITVPPEVVAAYEGKSREECFELAVAFSLENAKSLKKEADGFYIITTLGRSDIVTAITKEIRTWS